MVHSMIRRRARALFRAALYRRLATCDAPQLGAPAVIVAPHPDDEVLGCGGTIISMRRAGADVRIVFVTDGDDAHQGHMSAEEFGAARKNEALSAAKAMGVPASNVVSLGVPDMTSAGNTRAATTKLRDLLAEVRPREVFIPFAHDVHPEHVATSRAVLAAMCDAGTSCVVNEYPIWFWCHWPWARPWTHRHRDVLKNAMRGILGSVSLFRHFRHGVDVTDALQRKRAALAEHVSQTTGLTTHQKWVTLDDISKGEFLDVFFQPYEVFRRYAIHGSRRSRPATCD